MANGSITLELSPSQVERLVESLPVREKIRLVRKLENATWAQRLDETVSRIRKRFRQKRISEREIRRVCEEVRLQRYNERNKNRGN